MRLIDADAIKWRESTDPYDSWAEMSFVKYDDIENMPTIDAEPVRHGHWFEGGGLLMPMHKYDEYTNPEAVFYATCSKCRVTINCNGVLGGYSYCPHCGAKMDGGKENDT